MAFTVYSKTEVDTKIQALTDQVSALSTKVDELSPLVQQVADLSARIAALEAGSSPPDPDPTNASGMPWLSGVWAHRNVKVGEFEAMRSAPVDVMSIHPSRGSWSTYRWDWWWNPNPKDASGNPLPPADLWRNNPDVRLELSMPTFAKDLGVSVSQTQQWTDFGNWLNGLGAIKPIIVIGKEFNLPNDWRATNTNVAAWKDRFREGATALRNTIPGVTIVFCPNEGGPQTGLVKNEDAWPGDEFVDVVAPDYYDQWEPVYTQAQADARFARYGGIKWWYDFAVARGKKFGLSEWGVSSGTQWAGHCGGDNPFYIKAVTDFLNARKENVFYESYFDEPGSYVMSSLISQNPNARAEYKRIVAALRS